MDFSRSGFILLCYGVFGFERILAMRLRIASLIAAGSAVVLASCSTAPVQEVRSPKAAKELAVALAGRTAQPAVNCIPGFRSPDMQVIDDWTILYREGRTVYVQNPRGGCRGLGFGSYTLVTRKYGTHQTCSGDINQLVDLQSGFGGGSCVFGPFTPYTRS